MKRNVNVSMKIRYKMCKEALKTVTFLERLTVARRGRKAVKQYENWMGSVPNFASKLHTWSKAGVINEQTKSTPKIGDCGVTYMFVGYSKNMAMMYTVCGTLIKK